MDIQIERKPRFSAKRTAAAVGVVSAFVTAVWLMVAGSSSTMNVDRNSVTIAMVTKGEFNDYIRVAGRVIPDKIIYLDAVEGGRVEERLIEEGASVHAGDVILRMSNPLLNIGILQSEADLAYQENELRNTRLTMDQEHLRLKHDMIDMQKDVAQKKRRAAQYSRLFDKGFVAEEEYLRAGEDYEASVRQMEVLDRRIRSDEEMRHRQLQSLNENIANMKQSLQLVRQRLDNLLVRAPVDGQLGNIEAQVGQSISQGERIGQIITPELKVEVRIDEHYVEHIHPGLQAGFEREGKRYVMTVTKVYPEVQDGQFRTDLHFVSVRPENIRSGQTYHIDIRLGDPEEAVMIPRGSFYQSGGSRYVYVVDADGNTATMRRVRLGRQNPVCHEVLEGLSPGERVITSGYELFGDNQYLNLRN